MTNVFRVDTLNSFNQFPNDSFACPMSVEGINRPTLRRINKLFEVHAFSRIFEGERNAVVDFVVEELVGFYYIFTIQRGNYIEFFLGCVNNLFFS